MPRVGQRVAVTGVGLVTALGGDADSTFDRLCRGESGIGRLTRFDASALGGGLAAEVKVELDAGSLSRSDALALRAAREALARSGFPANERRGLALGATTGSMLEVEADLAGALSGAARGRRLIAEPLSHGVDALAAALGSTSVSATVCSACSSGAAAIIVAAEWIMSGRVEAALAGGTDAICRMTYAGFASLGVADRGPCRPFDVARAGLTLGEGSGFFLLESEASALARGATILGWLSGWALGAEAHHVTHPEPSGARAAALLREALTRAGREPAEVDYVNAHGTGTLANDSMEVAALRRAFGEHAARVWLSSNKGQLGHTLGAAGAIEAVATVLSLQSGRLPPSIGLEHPADAELRYVRDEAASVAAKVALSSSFGFGGMDAVLLFEHRDAVSKRPAAERESLVVSAVSCIGRDGACVNRAVADVATGDPPPAPLAIDPLAELEPERSRRFDRGTALVTRAAVSCMQAAGLPPAGVGLVQGSAYGSVDRSLKFLDRLVARGLKGAAPAEFPQLVPSGPAGNAAIYLGLSGPVLAVAERFTSGEAAVCRAFELVEAGLSAAILAGAAEAHDPIVAELAPTPGPRSEGAAVLLLEAERAARSRGHEPLARIEACVQLRRTESGFVFSASPLFHAPRAPHAARLLLLGTSPALERAIAQSPWSSTPCTRLLQHTGYFEAAGAVALAVAAAWVHAGASEVLVINATEQSCYLTHFEALDAMGGAS